MMHFIKDWKRGNVSGLPLVLGAPLLRLCLYLFSKTCARSVFHSFQGTNGGNGCEVHR